MLCVHAVYGESIRIATYNVENYLTMSRYINGVRYKDYPKPEAEKAVVRAVIETAMPDVLALQEIGTAPFLDELKADLAKEGLDYPYAVHMQGADPVRHLAVLSKKAPIEIVQHQDLQINYRNKPTFVKRGLLELTFEQTDGSVFKLFVVHLKSRWTRIEADPKSLQQRTLEAEACRNRILERTLDIGVLDFIVAGDFNDDPQSAPLQRLYRKGDRKIGTLVPPADSNGDSWTYYYRKKSRYSQVDGFIVSESLFPKIKDGRGQIADEPDVLGGSDHRMVYLDLLESN